jgi:hypothetical protein
LPKQEGNIWQAFEEAVTFLDPSFEVVEFNAEAVCERHI